MHPSRIPDDLFCVGMDITQLLFLMKWVFGKSEFDYFIEEKQAQIIPKADWKTEYEAMVVHAKEVLEKGRIIEIKLGAEREFDSTDYLKIDNDIYERSNAKNSLYFLTIVTKWYNCEHLVNERGDVTCYYLLDNQGGKPFVYYLIYMVTILLLAYVREDMEKANMIISALNNDFAAIEQLYGSVGEILENIERQDEKVKRGVYQTNFFVSQSDLLRDWISDHQKIMTQGDVLEFIFADSSSSANVFLKNCAVKLIYHIEKINEVFRKGEHKDFRWLGGLGAEPVCHDFYHLDHLIEKLEAGDESTLRDKKEWAGRYLRKLLQLIQELERMGSGLQ